MITPDVVTHPKQYIPMKKTLAALSLVLGLLIAFNSAAQTDKPKKEKAPAVASSSLNKGMSSGNSKKK